MWMNRGRWVQAVEICEHEPKVGRGMCRRCYGRDYYRKNSAYRDALNKQKRAKYAEAPEGYLQYGREHYAKNSEAHNARRAEWREANAERQRQTADVWRKNNLDRAAVTSHRRRAREANAEGTFSVEEWREILREFDSRCAYCQVPSDSLVMEHMTPLSRGGSNSAKNIVPSCAECNSRKGTRDIFGFLSKPQAIKK